MAPLRKTVIAVALLLVATLVLLPAPARAANFTIFAEGFEGAWPGPWTVDDEDLVAGRDYWGISSAREESGTFSAWMAQVGTNSKSGLPNSMTRVQDDSMNAYLRRPVPDLVGYDTATLRYDYWLEMGAGDRLSLRVFSGGAWFALWSVEGPQFQGWTRVTVSLPLSTEAIEFRYVSAPSHTDNFEGAYLDDVVLAGDDTSPPLLSLTEPAAGTWFASRTVLASWSVEDRGSGLLFTELRLDLGSWVNVGLATSQALTGLSEGLHTLAVRASDRAGNTASRTVTFGVDVSAPSVSILAPGDGSVVNTADVRLEWQASDAVSQVVLAEVRADDGAWTAIDADGVHELRLADGSHVVALRVTDAAGNTRQAERTIRVDTNPLSPDGPNKGLLLYLLIALAAALVALFLLARSGRLPFWPLGSGKGERGAEPPRSRKGKREGQEDNPRDADAEERR